MGVCHSPTSTRVTRLRPNANVERASSIAPPESRGSCVVSTLRRHRFHQERECLSETGDAGFFTFRVSHAHDNQIVRRHDQGYLAAGTRHVVGVPWYRKHPRTIYPEEGPIDRAPVGFPGRRNRAHEFDIAIWEDPLTFPHAVLQIEVAETRPVAARPQFVSLAQEIPEWIRFDHHG